MSIKVGCWEEMKMDKIEIKKEIIECLEEIGIFLDLNIDEDINICEYGMDSLGYINFICEIETKFNIEIPHNNLLIQEGVYLKSIVEIINEIIVNK